MDRDEFITFRGCLHYYSWRLNEALLTRKCNVKSTTRILDHNVEEFSQVHKFIDKAMTSCEGPKSICNPPFERWLKVNIDASWSDNGAMLAFVVHNYEGKLLFLTTKMISYESCFIVEAQALLWVWIMLIVAPRRGLFGLLMHKIWLMRCWGLMKQKDALYGRLSLLWWAIWQGMSGN